MPTLPPIWVRNKLTPPLTPAQIEERSRQIIDHVEPHGIINTDELDAECRWCGATFRPTIYMQATGENTPQDLQTILDDHLFHTHGIYNKKASA